MKHVIEKNKLLVINALRKVAPVAPRAFEAMFSPDAQKSVRLALQRLILAGEVHIDEDLKLAMGPDPEIA